MTKSVIKVGPLELLLGYHLRRASLAFSPEVRRPKRVPRGLIGILSVALANPGINQKTVGKILGIDPGTLVSLIDRLVENGYLKRSIHSEDRRVRSLSITPSGKVRLNEAVATSLAMETELKNRLSARERKMLVTLLKKLCD